MRTDDEKERSSTLAVGLNRSGPIDLLRRRLVRDVRGIFNDRAIHEQPVMPSDDALFARDTPIRIVHADVVAMMVGGMSALLMQILHPHALQGVLDHSDFRADMHGRLRRTARFIAVTTFGARDDAEAAIERVNQIHLSVNGRLADGTPYSATDPQVLGWVHLAEATSFLAAHLRYVRPQMTRSDQNLYLKQFAVIARKLHADPVPETCREAERLLRTFYPQLKVNSQTREVAHLILRSRPEGMAAPVQAMIVEAAIDLLPKFARGMLGLHRPALTALPARAGTHTLAQTVRWAFNQR